MEALERTARSRLAKWFSEAGLVLDGGFADAAVDYLCAHRTGIMLIGASGTGKTTLLRLLADKCRYPILRARKLQRRVASLTKAHGEEQGFRMAVNTWPIEFAGKYEYDLALDDLGKEAATTRSYGNATDIVSECIEERYEAWQRGRGVTLLTTELTYTQLREAYPAHVVNRIEEMTRPVILREVRRKGWA